MPRIESTYVNYVPSATTSTLVTGAGKIHAILATSNAAAGALVTLYDNTAASGNILLSAYVSLYHPVILQFDPLRPLKFSTGLTVVTASGVLCYIQTEE